MSTTKKQTASRTSKQPDAIELLKQDHDAVEKLFREFERSKDADKQHRLAQQMCVELTVHAKLEEQSFYPEVRTIKGVTDMVMESLEEHRQVKEMIARIQPLQAGDDKMEPDVKVLMDDVLHHVEEEEKEMFPAVRKEMGKERLEQLGRRMAEAKSELKRQVTADERRVTEEVQDPLQATQR